MSPDRFPGRPAPRFGADRPAPDRGPRPPFRPGGADSGDRPRPPFRPAPEAPHSVRLRDGDREIEIQGNPAFVRQLLDELPTLLRRLAGESAGPTAASIRMPRPAEESSAPVPALPAAPASSGSNGRGNGRSAPQDLEAEIMAVLSGEKRGLNVAEIRGRLRGTTTGQQVRRILERAGKTVSASSDRPARYRLR